MDVSLIDMDIETSDSGLKLVELIAKDYSDIVSVVLAGKGAVENAVLSLQAGAFTYILKGETEPALVCEVVPKAATYGCQSRDLQQSLQEAREALRKVAGDFSHAMETLLRVAEELQKLTLKRPHD
jgi:DNA-binding NtrC family response regulator